MGPPASAVSRLFTVSRAVNGSGDFVRVGDNTDPVFTDQVNASANSYCYRISYQDLCSNNATPSNPVCTVFLEREGENLGWTPDRVWALLLPLLGLPEGPRPATPTRPGRLTPGPFVIDIDPSGVLRGIFTASAPVD